MGTEHKRWVFLRDASFSASSKAGGRGIKYHWPNRINPGISECGRVLLNETTITHWEAPKKHQRCMAPGCKQRWETGP